MSDGASLDERILGRMPYPLSHLYQEMLDEADPRIRFRNLIKVFVGGLKYLSLVCIADYMRHPDSDEVNTTLSQSLKRPSLGHWMMFLRTIITYYREQGRQFHVRELEGVLAKRTNRLIDHLIHLRNVYVHPDVMPSSEESAQLCAETLPQLQELLKAFKFVADYPLVRRSPVAETEVEVMGAEIPQSEPGPSELLVRSTEGVDLDVTPFLLITLDEDLRDLLVYETLIGDRAKYIMGNHVQFVATGDEPDNRVRLLQGMIQRFASEEEERVEAERADARRTLREELDGDDLRGLALHAVRNLAHRQAEDVFNRYRHGGRYDARTYVRRTAVQQAYGRLLDGSSSGLVLVADSGVGKSTEICRLYVEDLADDIVWIVSGRTTRARAVLEALESQLFDPRDPDRDLGRVLARVDRERATERFVILFDGVNETDDPVEAFARIVAFVDAHPYDWLKVIVTCRSFAWKTIEGSGVVPDRRRFVLAADGSLANVLEPFDDAELRQALERYSLAFETPYPPQWAREEGYDYQERKLLRSPLILRFVFEAFRGRDIPVPLDIETVMGEFTRERLRRRDLPFLQGYLMTYFYRQETDVLDSRQLLDAVAEGARELLAETDRTAFDKLVEHICGEQVYDVDEVWRCCEPTCANHHRPLLPGDEEEAPPRSRCPLCHAEVELANVDNRSTFSRLLSENILSQTELTDHMLIRLVFDRYFEYLMRRHCFVDRMGEKYDPAVVTELFQKTIRYGIFIEPLKGVILSLWRAGSTEALFQVATMDDFAAYHVLREVLEEYAESDFAAFEKALRIAAVASGFNPNLCRAGVHALLVDPHLAAKHEEAVLNLLLKLSQCPSERVHEDAGEYLVTLRRRGVDLITPLVNRCGEALGGHLGILRGARLAATAAGRRRFKGQFTLFLNVVLFGLGNFFGDDAIRGAVVRNGLGLIQRLLRHPMLALFDRLLARFVSSRIARIYRDKGPLPCNYWEMLLQLRLDPEAIRRAGDLFFVERENLFDLDYERFRAAVHSENGLITWYLLSLLPVHYLKARDQERAVDHMHRLIREGTEMDRYVVGDGVAILLQNPDHRDERLEGVLEALGRLYLDDPSQIFLHPEPAPAVPEAGRIAELNRHLTEEIRAKSNPFMVPWMVVGEDGSLHRFYINSVIFHYALMRIRRGQPDELTDILDFLERNCTGDLLRFGDDVAAGRRFVASFLIQALGLAAAFGHLKEAFATLDRIIQTYIAEGRDPESLDAYRFAVVDSLKSIKDYHRREVLAFVDRYDLDQERFQFLKEVKTAAVEKEKLFSKSLYGHNIYQGSFASPLMREAFGEFTKRAASARDVEELFFIYTLSFMRWLKSVEA